MKFGKIDHPEREKFILPIDHPDTATQLQKNKVSCEQVHHKPRVYVGCAKWNSQDLKNFYPLGTKDELSYYSTQFNSIELNATFYRIFPASVFAGWKNKTPDDFVFFPKIPEVISHRKRLNGIDRYVEEFLFNASSLDSKLGTVFLQMKDNFSPKTMNDLVNFVQRWDKTFSLAIELRHTDWFNDTTVASQLYQLYEQYAITNVITDTAGRRDLLHMRLTTPIAFIRYVGANHDSDYNRLDDWIDRLKLWTEQGLSQICFFVHQNHELESPLLAQYFIKMVNEKLGCDLTVPATLPQQPDLF